MTPVEPLIGESKPGLAVGGGVLAGLLTLALFTVVLTVFGGDDNEAAADGQAEPGDPVAKAQLSVGDCIDPGTSLSAVVVLRDCTLAHPAQVAARLPYQPGANADYPGADQLKLWVADQCDRKADDYLGTALYSTSLDSGAVLPDFDDWAEGDTSVTCYVARLDRADLTASVEGDGLAFPRPAEVAVSRLLVGDCFQPAGGVGSYDLNSNSMVEVVTCADSYNGVFFGRDTLDSPAAGLAFPGDAEVGRLTSDRCSGLFEESFGVPVDGFNYRYWRPNQQSWNLGDRDILCAILDATALTDPFDPAAYQPFFVLDPGICFDLGPEETDETLGLDDQVLPVDCGQPHVGQMIGSGQVEAEAGDLYPGEDEVERSAGVACEQLFEEFVGITPSESELINFPYWFPNEAGWSEGDRRYACAFVDPVERVGSLEGAAI